MTLTKEDWTSLTASGLFAGIRKEEIETLLPCLSARKRQVPAGETLVFSGDPVRFVGLVLSGELLITRQELPGTRSIVACLLPGDTFGEALAALPGTESEADVSAKENACVLLLSLSGILHVCGSACAYHTRLVDNTVTLLAKRNLTLNEKLIHVTQKTTRDKVLSYLTSMQHRAHKRSFDIPLDRQGLADYLNVERSALSAELSKMKKDGLIDYKKNHFTLIVDSEE